MALKLYYTLFHFNESDAETQAEALYQYGEFIDRYRVGDVVYVLYAYHTFYIEVKYDPITNTIDSYQAISVDEAADKYVELQVLP